MNMSYRPMPDASLDRAEVEMCCAAVSKELQEGYEKNSSNLGFSVYYRTPLATVLSALYGSLKSVGQRGISELIMLGARFGF
jgi:hypothetical protein